MDASLVRTSKFLSFVLRHKPEAIGISLNDAGWVTISDLLAAANAFGRQLDLDVLLRVVHENDKQRFGISPDGKSIRANQGHSVVVDLGLTPTAPPTRLFHGTVSRFLVGIRSQGLIRRTRRYVHLSADRQTAEVVGRRRGEPVVLVVDSEGMANDGMSFFLSQNGVWLTAYVPVAYVKFP